MRFEAIPRAYEDDVDVHVGWCVDGDLGRSKMGMEEWANGRPGEDRKRVRFGKTKIR